MGVIVGNKRVRRVLLVDDHQAALNTWRRAFAREGMLVDAALTGAHAVALARSQPPDVAVVDLLLHQESGLQVLKDVKSIDSNVYVIIVSAYMNVGWAMHAIQLGADFCFLKPITCKQVVALVERGECPEPHWDDAGFGLEQFEWEFISRVLVDSGNNISRAARIMNLHVTTLRRKLEKRGVLPLPALPDRGGIATTAPRRGETKPCRGH